MKAADTRGRRQAVSRSGSTAVDRSGYPARVAGYVAAVRMVRADVRLAGTARPLLDRPIREIGSNFEVEELSGRPFGERLLDGWASFREQLAMTTFYLFDPESWR